MPMGHDVDLMAPKFIKPYVKTNKYDIADEEAICEAVTRFNVRFVLVKTNEQQAALTLSQSRKGFIKQRTAQVNQIKGIITRPVSYKAESTSASHRYLFDTYD
jgi:transposase